MSVNTLYHRIPTRLQWVLKPLVSCRRAYNELRPKFWIAEGRPREDDAPVRVLCVAPDRDRSFLLEQVLGECYQERCIGRAWLWNLSKVAADRGNECCAAMVRTWPQCRRLLGSQTWLSIPSWIEGEVNIPLSPRVLAAVTVKSDLSKMRKNGLSYEVTRDIRKFDDFYRHMYVPYIRRVHRSSAHIWTRCVLEEKLAGGELLLVNKQDDAVAGCLICYSKAGPELLVLGVRDGNREFVRNGALAAMYHFSFHHLVGKGFTKVVLGKSRAFLNDGVLRFKKKLGMKIVGASCGYCYLRVLGHAPAARTFLAANPLVFERDGLLYGGVFTEADVQRLTDEEFHKMEREFFLEGMARLLLVPLRASAGNRAPSSGLTGRIAVCDVSDVLGWKRC